MNLEKALLNCEIKKNTDNTYSFVMSDETIDRDGEVIKVDGWDLKNFKKNNVLMWGHRHDIPAIGTVGRAVKENGKLIAKNVRFATEGVYDLADTVHGLVDDGILKAVSVGYIPKEREFPGDDDDKGAKKKKPWVITTKAELYELSIVNVGANANALRQLKSAEDTALSEQKVVDDESKEFIDDINKATDPKGKAVIESNDPEGWEEVYFLYSELDEAEQKKFMERINIDNVKEIVEDKREGKFSELLRVGPKGEKPTEPRKQNPFADDQQQNTFKR